MKNIFLLFSLLSSFAYAQLPSNIPTDGLIGYWPLDGNANDVSGNENNGTVYGASVTSDRFGNPNKAYSFSVNESGGWGAAQHRIVVSNPTIPNNNSFTMSAWVNLEIKPSPFNNRSHSIMGRWDGNGDRVFRYQIKYSGEVYTQLYSDGNNYSHTSGNVPYSNWTHIVSTYDGFTLKHYVDGVLTGQENLGLTISSSTTNLTFGEIHMANGHWYLFSGEMDDLGYWSRALTENEVVNIYDTNQCSEVSLSASATEVCEGGSVDLEAIIAPSMNSNPAWELLIDESEYDSNRINLSETAYDRVNNNIFSVHKTGSELTFYKFDLNNNSVNNISTSFIPPNVGPFTFDTNNNMIVAGRVGRDNLYGVSPSGGSWISYGTGSFDSESYGSQYYWNSFNQKVGFFGGYGFYTVKNWIWENGGSWTNVFSNNNNCGSNIPAKRNTKFALGAPNSNELYFISGQGSCSGDQFASSCSLGDAWATDVGVYCWLKDLWKLDLDTYTFTNVLPVNNSSITQEGNFVYDYLDNSFYIVGGFVPSPTYDPNYGNITNFSNTVLKFRPDSELGFSEFNVDGNGPPVVSLNNIGPNRAYFDASNNQIVWIRKDGVWGISLDSNNNLITYLWSTGDTTANISVTPSETTEYWVDVTNNGVTCRKYITINVTAPAAPTGDSEQTLCDAATVADLTATGDSIQWYDTATGGNLLDSTTALTDGQMVYASQIVNGCESTDRLEVTVSLQEITATSSATEVCSGETVDLSVDVIGSNFSNWATGEPNNLALGTEHFGLFLSTGRWNDGPDSYTSANCIVESETNLGIVNNFTYLGVFDNHHYYLYDLTDGWNNCNNLANSLGGYLAIINSQLETNFIFNNLPSSFDRGWIGMYQDTNHPDYSEPGGAWFWVDGTPVAMSSNPSNYTWSTGDTIETISVTPTETTEYWVDVTTNGVTCREYITINVTSTAAPTGDPVQGGCSDFTVGSNNNTFIGENLQWYSTPSGGTALPESHLLVDGTYYYISQTVDGCESSDRFEFLYLAPEPTITIDSPVICEGESTSVSVSSSPSQGSTTFLWNTGETSDSITLSPTESTTFWVDQIYNSGGPENIQTVCRYFFGITVDNAPEAPVSGGDITECETITAQSLTAIASAVAGESITWYDTPTGGNAVADPSLSTAGTVTYYAEATNDTSGCSSLSRTAVTLTITSVAAPTGDAVQSFCDNVTVSDLSASGSNIQWYDAATGGNVLDPGSALSDGQLLYASQTENSCESVTRLEVSVEIDIIPDPILITTELEFCLAREATLADLEVDEQGFALEWYDSFSGGNMLPMDTLLEDGVSYYATLYDAASGCESLMRLEVVPTIIPCEVVIYNALSLNDNGINDYMVIENAEYFPDNMMEVYNRDGHLLYSQAQYGVGDNFFRGIANVSGIYGSTLSGDGPRLPTGSYLYVFKYFNPYEQQEYTLKGFLTINSN